jgi:hypothetical protein
MRLSYNCEEDILVPITAREGTIDHTDHIEPFPAHFSQNGKLLSGQK